MRDRRPLYARIAEKIKSDFSGSSATETIRLPGEAALAERYEVSRTTVREAYRLLEQEGSVFARHGVGTFLSSQPKGTTLTFDNLSSSSNLMNLPADLGKSTLIGCTMLPMSRPLRAVFGWPGDTLLRVEKLYRMDNMPSCYAIDVVPAAFVGGAVDDGSLDRPLRKLLSEGGFAPHHADSHLTAVNAPARVCKEAPELGEQPAIRFQDIYYDNKGQVLAICLQYQRASTFTFRIRRRIP